MPSGQLGIALIEGSQKLYEITCSIREQHGEYHYNFEAWSATPNDKFRVASSLGHLKVTTANTDSEHLCIMTVLSAICTKIAQGLDVELF